MISHVLSHTQQDQVDVRGSLQGAEPVGVFCAAGGAEPVCGGEDGAAVGQGPDEGGGAGQGEGRGGHGGVHQGQR